MNPIKILIKSRKFWLSMLDAVTSTVFLLMGAFWPEHQDLSRALVFVWNAPILVLIYSIAVEDAGQKGAAKS